VVGMKNVRKSEVIMDLKTILDMVTQDIKANRIAYGKKSNAAYIREIFLTSRIMACRVEN
jgi:precorrin-6B methylase 1